MRNIIVFIFVFFLSGLSCYAQINSNTISKRLAVEDTIFLDSLTIIPSSLKLADSTIEFRLLSNENAIIVNTKRDSIDIEYRTFPFNLQHVYQDSLFQRVEQNYALGYAFQIKSAQQERIDFGEVNYDGSLSRGVSVGNTRDLALNSNLNLNINGMLSNDIEVRATINDQNIPFQPDGNTAQIQEFDQVFIEMSKNNTNVRLGDLFLRNQNQGHFIRYNRKGQGIEYNYKLKDKLAQEEHHYSYAISKGKYNRYNLPIIEGNQGPYKLEGLNGERFIIILSGTERIYIDGVLLERGEANDYVIDYNLGEVTFTANKLINKDLRVQIEFEYAEQNFLRSLLVGNSNYAKGKWNYGIQIFRDADHKNQPILNEYGSRERESLIAAGDDILKAQVESFTQVGYSSQQIRYKKIDTTYIDVGLVKRVYDSVFQYSNHPDSAIYQVNFSYVGPNKGNYIASEELASGRKYKYVQQIGGRPQGEYTPHVQLVAAQKKELYSANASRSIGQNGQLSFEIVRSNTDINTFSKDGDEDNTGYASYTEYEYASDSIDLLGSNWQLKNKLFYEMNTSNFRKLERFRTVEFNRNWNITDVEREIHLLSNRWSLSNHQTNINYGLDYMNYDQSLNGLNQLYGVEQKFKNFNFILKGSYLKKSGSQRNTFNRPSGYIDWVNPKSGWKFYIKRLLENNEDFENDTLNNLSFMFIENSIGTSSSDTSIFNTNFEFRERIDYIPNQGEFELLSRSWNYQFNENIRINSNNKIGLGIGYRLLDVFSEQSQYNNDESILSRVEYFGKLWRNSLKSNLFYEVGSGLERKREYRFVQVQVGQGQYTWIDNDNDNQEDLNEFFLNTDRLNVQSGMYNNYTRVFTLGNEFVPTQNISFAQSLFFDPKRLFEPNTKAYKFSRKFQFLSNVKLINKFSPTQSLNDYNVLNTYDLGRWYDVIPSDSIISNELSARNQLFLWRSNTKFGIQLVRFTNQRKDFLSTGFETRSTQKNQMGIRFRPYTNSTFNLDVMNGEKSLNNAGFTENGYQLDLLQFKPSYSLVLNNAFSLKFVYSYTSKVNDVVKYDSTTGVLKDYGVLLRYFKSQQGNLNLKFSFVDVMFNSDLNTPVAFAVLEGLQPGNNIVWGLGIDKVYQNNLQVNIAYDGRKSINSPIIHIGSMTLRYLF